MGVRIMSFMECLVLCGVFSDGQWEQRFANASPSDPTQSELLFGALRTLNDVCSLTDRSLAEWKTERYPTSVIFHGYLSRVGSKLRV